MEVGTTVAEVHKAAPAAVHSSGRRHRSQSRHEKHKCHKHKQRIEESELANEVTLLKNENYLLNRRLNASMSSISVDSGLPFPESLPPFDIDLRKAYQHVKLENTQLLEDVKSCRIESEKLKSVLDAESSENSCLKDDVSMLKNLVYRLNVELEKFQDLRDKERNTPDEKRQPYQLPCYYNKNFLKPLLPLLRAYTETIQEKNDVIHNLERSFDKFNVSFNELLKENEVLYKELEGKVTRGDESLIDEVKMLRSELKMTRSEKDLFQSQATLEAEKLKEIQAVYQTNVTLVARERDVALDKLQEARADTCTLQGKHSVVKQELERLRCEEESKVHLAVHTASVAECKRLFQTLRNEHDSEKDELLRKLKERESKLTQKDDELRKNEQERLNLEQSNFDLVFECDSMREKICELEKRLVAGVEGVVQGDLSSVKAKLTESLKKNDDLEAKLEKAKRKLHQSMGFAEDLVKEQEALLAQLHEKQMENSAMATQFGSLKEKLKGVEKGASAGLDSVEATIRKLTEENEELVAEVGYLRQQLLQYAERVCDTGDTSS